MEEGETKVYETEDGVYVVSLLSISDIREKVVFRLNDEMSKGIKLKDSYVFKDGSEIVLRDLVLNSVGEAADEAYYYFYGTGEKVLELRNVSRYVVDNKLCNFDTQCLNESKENCCYDCGCGEGEKCENNECVSTEEEDIEEELIEVGVEEEEELIEDVKKGKRGKIGLWEKIIYIAIIIIIVKVFLISVWYIKRKGKKRF